VKGWSMTPSIYVGQDLAEVWLDRQPISSGVPAPGAGSRTARNGPAAPAARSAL